MIGALVGAIISVTTIVVVITIAALVITRKWKAKECATFDLEAAVSVNKSSMWILVYCTVNVYAVWRWFILMHKTKST